MDTTLIAVFVDCLKEWQTLMTGVIATVAAIWTIRVMNGQRRDETLRHSETERRRKMAARAAMPDALSELSHFARGCAQRLVGQADALPSQPVDGIRTLKSVIEFIDDEAAARTFELVSWYQVCRARLESGIPARPKLEFTEYLYDVALLQAYANSLYDYARNEADNVATGEVPRDVVMSGLKNTISLTYYVMHEEDFKAVVDMIERRHTA